MVPIFDISLEIEILCPFQQLIHFLGFDIEIFIIKFIFHQLRFRVDSLSKFFPFVGFLSLFDIINKCCLLGLLTLHIDAFKPLEFRLNIRIFTNLCFL